MAESLVYREAIINSESRFAAKWEAIIDKYHQLCEEDDDCDDDDIEDLQSLIDNREHSDVLPTDTSKDSAYGSSGMDKTLQELSLGRPLDGLSDSELEGSLYGVEPSDAETLESSDEADCEDTEEEEYTDETEEDYMASTILDTSEESVKTSHASKRGCQPSFGTSCEEATRHKPSTEQTKCDAEEDRSVVIHATLPSKPSSASSKFTKDMKPPQNSSVNDFSRVSREFADMVERHTPVRKRVNLEELFSSLKGTASEETEIKGKENQEAKVIHLHTTGLLDLNPLELCNSTTESDTSCPAKQISPGREKIAIRCNTSSDESFESPTNCVTKKPEYISLLPRTTEKKQCGNSLQHSNRRKDSTDHPEKIVAQQFQKPLSFSSVQQRLKPSHWSIGKAKGEEDCCVDQAPQWLASTVLAERTRSSKTRYNVDQQYTASPVTESPAPTVSRMSPFSQLQPVNQVRITQSMENRPIPSNPMEREAFTPAPRMRQNTPTQAISVIFNRMKFSGSAPPKMHVGTVTQRRPVVRKRLDLDIMEAPKVNNSGRKSATEPLNCHESTKSNKDVKTGMSKERIKTIQKDWSITTEHSDTDEDMIKAQVVTNNKSQKSTKVPDLNELCEDVAHRKKDARLSAECVVVLDKYEPPVADENEPLKNSPSKIVQQHRRNRSRGRGRKDLRAEVCSDTVVESEGIHKLDKIKETRQEKTVANRIEKHKFVEPAPPMLTSTYEALASRQQGSLQLQDKCERKHPAVCSTPVKEDVEPFEISSLSSICSYTSNRTELNSSFDKVPKSQYLPTASGNTVHLKNITDHEPVPKFFKHGTEEAKPGRSTRKPQRKSPAKSRPCSKALCREKVEVSDNSIEFLDEDFESDDPVYMSPYSSSCTTEKPSTQAKPCTVNASKVLPASASPNSEAANFFKRFTKPKRSKTAVADFLPQGVNGKPVLSDADHGGSARRTTKPRLLSPKRTIVETTDSDSDNDTTKLISDAEGTDCSPSQLIADEEAGSPIPVHCEEKHTSACTQPKHSTAVVDIADSCRQRKRTSKKEASSTRTSVQGVKGKPVLSDVDSEGSKRKTPKPRLMSPKRTMVEMTNSDTDDDTTKIISDAEVCSPSQHIADEEAGSPIIIHCEEKQTSACTKPKHSIAVVDIANSSRPRKRTSKKETSSSTKRTSLWGVKGKPVLSDADSEGSARRNPKPRLMSPKRTIVETTDSDSDNDTTKLISDAEVSSPSQLIPDEEAGSPIIVHCEEKQKQARTQPKQSTAVVDIANSSRPKKRTSKKEASSTKRTSVQGVKGKPVLSDVNSEESKRKTPKPRLSPKRTMVEMTNSDSDTDTTKLISDAEGTVYSPFQLIADEKAESPIIIHCEEKQTSACTQPKHSIAVVDIANSSRQRKRTSKKEASSSTTRTSLWDAKGKPVLSDADSEGSARRNPKPRLMSPKRTIVETTDSDMYNDTTKLISDAEGTDCSPSQHITDEEVESPIIIHCEEKQKPVFPLPKHSIAVVDIADSDSDFISEIGSYPQRKSTSKKELSNSTKRTPPKRTRLVEYSDSDTIEYILSPKTMKSKHGSQRKGPTKKPERRSRSKQISNSEYDWLMDGDTDDSVCDTSVKTLNSSRICLGKGLCKKSFCFECS